MSAVQDEFATVSNIAAYVKDLYKDVARNNVNYYDAHIRPVAGACAELNHRYTKIQMSDLLIVALLHDCREDFDISFRNQTCRQQKALELITRDSNETYFDYIARICAEESYPGYLARFVKLVVLTHNMLDLKEGNMKDKYRFAEHYIRARTNPKLYPTHQEIVEALA